MKAGIRQALKALAAVAGSGSLAFALLYMHPRTSSTLEEILGILVYLVVTLGTMTYAMFTYVDNISKELVDFRKDVEKSKFDAVQAKLGALKVEILGNGVWLSLSIFILERISKSAAPYLVSRASVQNSPIVEHIIISFRFGLFATCILAIFFQLKGFQTAVRYRELMATNRK